MPKTQLTPQLVKQTSCPTGKVKCDLFDSNCKGLMIEIRATGGKTYYLRYKDHRGRARQLKIADERDLSLGQARQMALTLRTKIALGEDPREEKATAKQSPTFATFMAERYMPFVKGYKKSWDCDDSLLRNHLLPALGKKHLDEITKHDVISFHHGMRAKGYAVGTCNRGLILLRYAMNLALKWEIPGITKNPTKDAALFENHNKKERFLSNQEAQRLYEAVKKSDNPMLQYIVPMLILTGARKREVLDAKWEDFDLIRRQWRIPTTKSGRPRHVPLSEGVLQLLDSIPQGKGCDPVFANPKTKKAYNSIFFSWNTARKSVGLGDVRMHDLRHSFASFLVNAGRSLYEVQKILGHTQIKTTQRYAHLSQDTLLEAANVVFKAVPLLMSLPKRVGDVQLVQVAQ
jgi:integrase